MPGSSDIFIRRFQMGVQLSGILLAGIGAVFAGTSGARRRTAPLLPEDRRPLGLGAGRPGPRRRRCASSALVVVLAPAWSSSTPTTRTTPPTSDLQAQADAQQDPHIDELLAYVRAHPRGRVYAGQPTNWGADFGVGAVPVFKYLESKDVDEVGYTLRTASLMTDPEYYFDDANPGDYPLFGIGYLIVPECMAPPVPAQKVTCSGRYCLWALPDPGYIHVYDTTGVLHATRADVGSQSETLLGSPLLEDERDLTVAFNGRPAADPTAPDAAALVGPPGHVVVEHADLPNGMASAVVRTTRRATVVLERVLRPRDGGATVDGQPGPDGHGGARPSSAWSSAPGCTRSPSATAATAPTPLFVLALAVLAAPRRRALRVAPRQAAPGAPRA